jgi:hypothetical protein
MSVQMSMASGFFVTTQRGYQSLLGKYGAEKLRVIWGVVYDVAITKMQSNVSPLKGSISSLRTDILVPELGYYACILKTLRESQPRVFLNDQGQ